jgi:Tfp pilus assembly protein FimT
MAEVLVVMVIFGLLAMMAVPRMSLTPFRSSSAARVVGSALLAAARGAVARQHNVIVAVDEPGRRLRIHYDADDDGAMDAGEWVRYEPLPDGVVFGRAGAPAGRIGAASVSFRGRQGGLPAITFLRNGSASEEGGFYMATTEAVARSRAADARMVVVDRATGRPSWLTYDGARWKTEF